MKKNYPVLSAVPKNRSERRKNRSKSCTMIATTNSTEGGTQTESIAMLLLLVSWVTTTIDLFLSSKHFPLHHSISWEFSNPCCPQQGIFPSSTVQTLVSLSINNLSVGWSFCPASRCYLLDVRGSQTLESLSTRNVRSLLIKLCIMFRVFVYVDGHKRGQTSRSVVGNKIQTNSNFKAHIHHWSYVLDLIRRRYINFHFTLSNNPLV